RTGIEPDIENVVDLLPAFVAALAEEALASAGLVPGVGALGLESLDDADIHFRIVENLHRTVRLFLDEHRDRHTPGALARDHPIGAGFDHAGDAVLALCRHPARGPDRRQRTVTQRVVRLGDVFIHSNEPLRRIAVDHRLLGAPGMRILVLEPAAPE